MSLDPKEFVLSNAKDIADERLAKGEITKEEHSAIISSIGEASVVRNKNNTNDKSASNTSIENFIVNKIASILIPAIVVIMGIGYFRYESLADSQLTQCTATVDAAKCQCMLSVFRENTSFLDETPILKIFRDQSDARSEAISNEAISVCFK